VEATRKRELRCAFLGGCEGGDTTSVELSVGRASEAVAALEYTVVVHTSNVRGAGTSANVTLTLRGEGWAQRHWQSGWKTPRRNLKPKVWVVESWVYRHPTALLSSSVLVDGNGSP
jgi:hypothetical protein